MTLSDVINSPVTIQFRIHLDIPGNPTGRGCIFSCDWPDSNLASSTLRFANAHDKGQIHTLRERKL